MGADPQRHFVIAIYGVGNPAPGDVERSLQATLSAAVNGVPFQVREFDWNSFAVHAPRATGRLWKYSQLFSGSFAAAAWFRTSRPTAFERTRASVDAMVHGLWAATQALVAVLAIVAGVLYLLGAASRALAGWIHPMVAIGVLPGAAGWRASVLSGLTWQLAVSGLQYGVIATAGLLGVSAAIALLEAVAVRSMRPLAVTARRHALVMLLAPCALLSLAFRREDSEPVFGRDTLLTISVFGVIGLAITGVLSLLMGGGRSTLWWAFIPLAAVMVIAVAAMFGRFLRGEMGGLWLGSAKVLLDIGLYVGTPSYRAEIQEQLDRVIAAIPDRSTTAIWVVAHSLGSVIALDSLTHSSAWQPTDSVRLVTLGSPIRRFFIRFFPGAFFAPEIDTAARAVASRLGQFTWLNVFRRLDYIGTALGFRQSGRDLPTRQFWPAHANYWNDARVARTVLDGLPHARVVETSLAPAGDGVSPVPGLPGGMRSGFDRVALAVAIVLALVFATGAFWMVTPGMREMLVRPAVHLDAPVTTAARVRHERGFFSNSRMHEFRFDFRDEAGRERQVSSSVPGFFGVWSDPRFDYLALARFVREQCTPERVKRFYEFGWSVPCSRPVPIAYDRQDPTRFRAVGFEYAPGLLARGTRVVLTVLLIVMGVAIPLLSAVVLALFWIWLWGTFVGNPDMVEELFKQGDNA